MDHLYIKFYNNTTLSITVSAFRTVNMRVSIEVNTTVEPHTEVTVYSSSGHWTISTLYNEEEYDTVLEQQNKLVKYRNLATINYEPNIYGHTDNIVDSYFKLVYDKENNTVTWSRAVVW